MMTGLPKMSYEEQQSHNALAAIDAAAQPYTPGEDTMTTIARANLQAFHEEQAAKELAIRALMRDFINWYLTGHFYPGDIMGEPDEIIDAFIAYQAKQREANDGL